MKMLKPLLVAVAALAASQAHAVSAFTYTFGAVPAGTYAAPTFTNGTNATTETTSKQNVYLQPAGTSGSFLVISTQPTPGAGQATIATGGVSSYSFVWGSPDTFNVVDIYGAKGEFAEYTGADLQSQFHLNAVNGDNANTGLFTINAATGSVIDHLVLKSSGVAFEMAAPVPEPETYALMLAGLGALGFMSRRKRA